MTLNYYNFISLVSDWFQEAWIQSWPMLHKDLLGGFWEDFLPDKNRYVGKAVSLLPMSYRYHIELMKVWIIYLIDTNYYKVVNLINLGFTKFAFSIRQ